MSNIPVMGGSYLLRNGAPQVIPADSWQNIAKVTNGINVNEQKKFVSSDGKPKQWSLLLQMSPDDIANSRFAGIHVVQSFRGSETLAVGALGVDGKLVYSAGITDLVPGVVARVGSCFRAFGDTIYVRPYSINTSLVQRLSVQLVEEALTPYTQPLSQDDTAGSLAIPFFASHVEANVAGNLRIYDNGNNLKETIVSPVPGTYYPLAQYAASVDNSGAKAQYTFSFRIFG